jgi:hypothetical protein
VFHFVDDLRSFPAHDFHSMLVCQIIAPLYRVKSMFFPGIVPAIGIVGKRRVDAALCRDGVRTDRMDLGYNCHIIFFAEPYGRSESRETSTDNENVMRKHYYDMIAYIYRRNAEMIAAAQFDSQNNCFSFL